MDDAVTRSMLKWPAVPAVYGWLSLDRRGSWRIRTEEAQFEPIGNAALRAFIGRNYLADERGCWYFQNGPQRVFVSLAYVPLVLRLEGDRLVDHCGRAGKPVSAWLDEEGSLLLRTECGLGMLDGRDLGVFADGLADGVFALGGLYLAVGRIAGEELESRFGFVREPRA